MRTGLALCALVLIGCGKKDAPVAPLADTTDPTANALPTEPAADTAAGQPTDPTAKALPADTTEAAPDAPAYLVWWNDKDDHPQSLWVGPHGEEATRPQATVFANDTLWLLEPRYQSFTQVPCEGAEDPAPPRTRWRPQLVARGVVGKLATELIPLGSPPEDMLSEPQPGRFELMGDLWGNNTTLLGGWRGLILLADCEAAFTCGAHGNVGCLARAAYIGEGAPTLDAAVIAAGADTEALFKRWRADLGEDYPTDGFTPTPNHVALAYRGGALVLDVVYQLEVAYADSDGSWSSYSQARELTVTPPAALKLELPAPVKAALDARKVDGVFGWSEVPAEHVVAARRAFDDRATLPKPAPEESELDKPAAD